MAQSSRPQLVTSSLIAAGLVALTALTAEGCAGCDRAGGGDADTDGGDACDAGATACDLRSPAGFFVFGWAGETTTGGLGYPIVYITSAPTDNGASINTPGTLRYITMNPAGPCLQNGGCDVRVDPNASLSGTVLRTTPLILPDNVTLDLSGAANQGLQFRGRSLQVGNNNVIRYYKCVGNVASDGIDDCIHGEAKTNVVLDHVLALGGTDENVDLARCDRVTIQHSMITRPGHFGHPFGLLSTSNHVALYRNLISEATYRNPLIETWASGPDVEFLALENVVYDALYHMSFNATSGHKITASVHRNIFRLGPPHDAGVDQLTVNDKIPLQLEAANQGQVYIASGVNTLMDNGARTWHSLFGTITDPPTPGVFDEYQQSSLGGAPNSWPTATCAAPSACGQRTASDPLAAYIPSTGMEPADLLRLVSAESGATRPCRGPIGDAVAANALDGTRNMPWPTHTGVYADPTRACGHVVPAPSIDAGSDLASTAGASVALNAIPSTEVGNPTILWTVIDGNGPGDPCEPPATLEAGLVNTGASRWEIGETGHRLSVATASFGTTGTTGQLILGPSEFWPDQPEVVDFVVASSNYLTITSALAHSYPAQSGDRVKVRALIGSIENPWAEDTTIKPRSRNGTCTLQVTIYDGVNMPVTDTVVLTSSQ